MTTNSAEHLHVDIGQVQRATLVRPQGLLDIQSYPYLRDTLIKCAAEEPDAVVVELDALDVASEANLSVFSTVSMRTAEWPGVPLLLVAHFENRREQLRRGAVGRFVASFPDILSALAATGDPPRRRREVISLRRAPESSMRARQFVADVMREWGLSGIQDLVADAKLVVTELVENTLRHTGSLPEVRLEFRRGLLTVAVTDEDPRPAMLRERVPGRRVTSGLVIVAQLCRVWGSTPTLRGGKIVWAVLPAGQREFKPVPLEGW